MTIPPTLIDWLHHKVENQTWASVGETRSVSHTWSRQTGGRVMKAALSASIEPSAQFNLAVHAESVESEYVTAATSAVITTLLSQSYAPVLACKVTLFAFEVHEENSSYAAFYAVTKEAIEQLLGVAPNTIHNIAW